MAISDQAFWSRKITFSLLGREGEDEIAREFDSDLSVEFDVQKTRSAEPNKADIKLFNLSPATRNQIAGFSGGTAKGEFTKIRLAAGYAPNGKDNSEVIFEGYIRRFWHAKEDTDWVTYITAGDGDLDYRNVTVNRSFGKGTPYSDIVRYILSRMPDVGAGDLSGLSEMGVTDTGYTLAGWGKRFLDEIARKHDLRWSIQDGKMEIVSNSKVSESVTIQRLRPAQYNAACELVGGSGMVGIPVVTEYGITVKSLMLPAIRPNAIIQVESLTRDATDEKALLTETEAGAGRYRVNAARYQGSNFGNDYYVTADCQAVKDGEVVRPDHKGHAAGADEIGESEYYDCKYDSGMETKAEILSGDDEGFAIIYRTYNDKETNAIKTQTVKVSYTIASAKLLENLFSQVSNEYFEKNDGRDLSQSGKDIEFCDNFFVDPLGLRNSDIANIASQVIGGGIDNLNPKFTWSVLWESIQKISVRANFDDLCSMVRNTSSNGYYKSEDKIIYLYDGAFNEPVKSIWGHKSIFEVIAHELAHFIYHSQLKLIQNGTARYTEDEWHSTVATKSKELLRRIKITCIDDRKSFKPKITRPMTSDELNNVRAYLNCYMDVAARGRQILTTGITSQMTLSSFEVKALKQFSTANFLPSPTDLLELRDDLDLAMDEIQKFIDDESNNTISLFICNIKTGANASGAAIVEDVAPNEYNVKIFTDVMTGVELSTKLSEKTKSIVIGGTFFHEIGLHIGAALGAEGTYVLPSHTETMLKYTYGYDLFFGCIVTNEFVAYAD